MSQESQRENGISVFRHFDLCYTYSTGEERPTKVDLDKRCYPPPTNTSSCISTYCVFCIVDTGAMSAGV